MSKPLRNSGCVKRTNNGYIGKINIDNVIFDINCTFWSDRKPNYIWLQRIKEKVFDEKTKTFTDYTPLPAFECIANKQNKKETFAYCGEFMFIGLKYTLKAWFEDKSEHQLNISVKRNEIQPVINRLRELNQDINNQI